MTDEIELLDIIESAEAFVKHKFSNHDPSHDWHHVHRVRLMALNLTRCPSLAENAIDLLIVELAALFHDLCDEKYAKDKTSGGSSSTKTKSSIRAADVLTDFFKPFLATAANIDEDSLAPQACILGEQVQLIYRIVDSVSWSKEQKRRERIQRDTAINGGQANAIDVAQDAWENECPEFKCVSDADRLDAIGSIGILRVAAYSAITNRPLHIPPANPQNDSVPPAEQAQGYNGSAMAHFHDKLLKIRGDQLRTVMAREEAERRQAMMSSFLNELDLEWMVADQGAQLSLLS